MKKKLFAILAAILGCFFIATNAWSVCSNYTTFTNAQILTHTHLNSLQTNYTNCVNDVLNGDTFTGNMTWHSGTDIIMYSDTGSELTAAIYGNNGKIYGGPQKNGTYGLTLLYSANILSITCNNATCADNNPGYVVMPATTAGQKVTLRVDEATHLFEDDGGTSDIVGEEFGVSTGVAWGSVRPFFLYAVNSDDTDSGLAFAISPNPAATESPVTNNIGYHGNAATNQSDTNFFFLTSTDVTATHNEKPALLIGAIEMTMSTSDDWTVASLDTHTGIGVYPWRIAYTLPVSQMGATATKYFDDNAGTAPTYTATNDPLYWILQDGTVVHAFTYSNAAGGTAGAGAVTLLMSLPYAQTASMTNSQVVGAVIMNNGGNMYLAMATIGASSTQAQFSITSAINALLTVRNADQGGVARSFQGTIRYKAF